MSSREGVSLDARIRGLVANPLVLSFYLPALLVAICDGLLVPVLPIFAKELDASYGLVGLVVAAQGAGMLLGDVPSGVLIRRLGHKGSMILGVGLSILTTVFLFWTDSVPLAVVWRLVSGFGRALWNIARHAYITEAVTVESRGRAISALGGVFRVGGFVGPTLGGVAATHLGLRSAFLITGVLGAAAVALVGWFARDMGGTAPARSAHRVPGGHLWAALKGRYKVLLAAGMGQLLAQTIRAGRSLIVPLYGSDVLGLDVAAIGIVVSISSAVDMALFYPAGWIMDHLGRKWAIVPSFLLQGIGMALLPFTGGFLGLSLATAVVGFGNGLGSGSMMTLGSDLAPGDQRGEFLGMWRFIGDAGSSGGPLAVGGVADLVTLPMAAWVMCAVGVAAAAVFVLLVPEPLRRPRFVFGAGPRRGGSV